VGFPGTAVGPATAEEPPPIATASASTNVTKKARDFGLVMF
jgi:hypothetical protein